MTCNACGSPHGTPVFVANVQKTLCAGCAAWVEKAREMAGKEENMPEKLKELEHLSTPLVDYLRDNYDPHTVIVIQDDLVRLYREEMGVPIPLSDDY